MLGLGRKPWKRAIGERGFGYVVNILKTRQLQVVLGTTQGTYEGQVKKTQLPVLIDELGDLDGGKLMWIGKRRKGRGEKVVLYIPGGGFIFPMQEPGVAFWGHLQAQFEHEGKPASVACLNYSLVPTVDFPTPLVQVILAIHHLISLDIAISDIHLAGDSAGANIVVQVLTHILHPLPGVPQLKLNGEKLGSVTLISPWMILSTTPTSLRSRAQYDSTDILKAKTIQYWGDQVLASVPSRQIRYIEPTKAPPGWLTDIPTLVARMLVIAGEEECLIEDIRLFVAKLNSEVDTKEMELVYFEQPMGVHVDPYLDFVLPMREEDMAESGRVVRKWIGRAFE
ncbi:Alpha/Beta hydrolase protein [Crucibulum laeve]|uniref:Alpha/Beta hydrolase protein n=1 Tax=Crucibulum laeve TaxID=68775 RepID=A0A5C3LVK8_9AGAR|nr:Alpha/Beta hydrolase protein [Crucibulum laeve]